MKKIKNDREKGSGAIALELRKLGVLVEHIDDKVSLVAERIMKENMEVMKTDIELIKHGLKRKIDVEEFAALERRVSLLEKRR